jgi:hypothetical protein
VAFHHVFQRATDWAYSSLLPAACSAEGTCFASWVLAAALVLPQSILLGATFPLLVSGIMRATGTDAGRQVSLLYFLNSIGASRVCCDDLVIIPAIGLPGTTLSAGIANIVIAIVVGNRRRLPAGIGCCRCAACGVEHDHADSGAAAAGGLGSDRVVVVPLRDLLDRMLSLVLGASTHAFG